MIVIITTVCALAFIFGVVGIVEWRENRQLDRAKILSALIELEAELSMARLQLQAKLGPRARSVYSVFVEDFSEPPTVRAGGQGSGGGSAFG